MKARILFVLALAAGIFLLGLMFAGAAQAGDDPVFQLVMSADAGSGAECTGILQAKTRYAVQPTVDTYVRVSLNGDAGVTATSASVKVAAGKLYDTPTTATQRYICGKPVSAGAQSALNGFINRGPTE